MKVLALDTCLGALSVAASWTGADGRPHVQDAYEEMQTGHAEHLMPMLAEVMARAGLAFADLDRIAVSVGPGSFTGVRVGVAAARGLALAAGKPVVGMTSLAVIAHRAAHLLGDERGQRPLVVATDARRGLVYAQVFDQALLAGGEPALVSAPDLATRLGRQPVVVVGSAAVTVATAIDAVGGVAQATLCDLQPHARFLAAQAPTLTPHERITPLYVRAPDVKPQEAETLPRVAP